MQCNQMDNPQKHTHSVTLVCICYMSKCEWTSSIMRVTDCNVSVDWSKCKADQLVMFLKYVVRNSIMKPNIILTAHGFGNTENLLVTFMIKQEREYHLQIIVYYIHGENSSKNIYYHIYEQSFI